jgi:hypothetical protein
MKDEDIAPGNFVQMLGESDSTHIGLVHKIISQRAGVWWYVGERATQNPWVADREHPVAELKIVEEGKEGVIIPESMLELRSKNFPQFPPP